MRPRTPGFVGGRLREAREVRGVTAVALSEMRDVNVTPQAISSYENGKSSPSPEVLRAIASAVNLPEHFFLMAERDQERGTIFYRSMSSATKSARARADRRHDWLRDIVRYLSEFVELPPARFPVLNLPEDPILLSDAEIEDAADEVRRFWGMGEGPIANMVSLLENQGAVIARDQLFAETLDGLSHFSVADQRLYIIIGTDKGTSARWRFDCAHELGHAILHAHVPPELLTRAERYKRIEEQAHLFAAAFLLPLEPFGDDFFAANLDTLVALKPKWKASIAMMITRAHRAGFITEDTARRLWINLSRRGWKRNEPYDDTLEPEEPRLLRRAFELVLESGAQTPDDIVAKLALSLSDVEALSGLPKGYLASFAPVVLREPATTDVVEDALPANIVRLPFRTRTS